MSYSQSIINSGFSHHHYANIFKKLCLSLSTVSQMWPLSIMFSNCQWSTLYCCIDVSVFVAHSVCVCVCVCGWVHPSGWFSSSSPNTTAGVLSHAVNTNYWQELWLNWDIPHRHTKTHTHRSRLFHQNTNMRSHTNTPTHTQQHEYKTDLVSFRGITVFLYVTSSW